MAAAVSRREPYFGEKKKALREGSGTYEYDNKFFKYEGQWKNGKKHGHGKLVFIDGSYYEGLFHMGEIQGFGTRYFANTKTKYQGQFYKGELHGKGRMVWPDGSIYEGQWDHNKRQGFGIMKSVKENLIYKGSYVDNRRQGTGTMIYPKGDRYDGDWQCDVRHGDGDMKYMDGTVYEGQFEDDNFNGVGTMRHCSGLVYHGIWQNGNPTVLPKKLVIVNASGKEPVEIIQGKPFEIKVQCVNEDGQVVEVDTGRELRVTAGFKHIKAKKGTALFDLIEEYEEKPMQTPYYDVLQYPLTDFVAEEEINEEEVPEKEGDVKEELKEEKEETEDQDILKPDEETSETPAISQTEEIKDTANGDNQDSGKTDQEPTEQGTIPSQSTEQIASESDQQTTETPSEPHSSLMRSDSIISIQSGTMTPGSVFDTPLLDRDSRPLPPPVINKRSENGECEWKNIQLAQAPPRFPPFVALDEEERKTKARQQRQEGGNNTLVPIIHLEAKRLNRISHDERFARVGEYIIMVHDATTPPFMGQTLEPAFISVKLKKPKREKKPKEVKPKWDTSKHIAQSMVRT